MQETNNEDILNQIHKSGHALHLDTIKLLRKHGWTVEVSPYYLDELSDKSREIDIIASKQVPVKCSSAFSSELYEDSFNINLFIECKYIKNDVIFILDNIGSKKLSEAVSNSFSKIFIDTKAITSNSHHYLKLENKLVAKLFETKEKDSGGGNVIFNAFTQSIKSLIYFREKELEKSINIPVVVVRVDRKNNPEQKLYTYQNTEDIEITDKVDQVSLEINYSYKNAKSDPESELFIVDFISFTRLDEYLDSVKIEEKFISDYLRRTLEDEMESDEFGDDD